MRRHHTYTMGDDAIIPASDFKAYTQNLLDDDVITVKQAKELYTEVWNDLVKDAKAYEKYKIADNGFTRDENNRSKTQLRSRSKQKFTLMDEIFEPQKKGCCGEENYVYQQDFIKQSSLK